MYKNGLDLLIEAVKIMEKKESKVEKTQEETPQRTIPKVTKRPEEEKKEINDVILQTMIFYNDGYNEILIKVHHSFHFKQSTGEEPGRSGMEKMVDVQNFGNIQSQDKSGGNKHVI